MDQGEGVCKERDSPTETEVEHPWPWQAEAGIQIVPQSQENLDRVVVPAEEGFWQLRSKTQGWGAHSELGVSGVGKELAAPM